MYVGFFEVGLNSLRPGGQAWIHLPPDALDAQPVRPAAARKHGHRGLLSVETVIPRCTTLMHSRMMVSAYPSITVISRTSQGSAIVATAKRGFDEDSARRVPHLGEQEERCQAERSDLPKSGAPADLVWGRCIVAERFARETRAGRSAQARPTGA